MIEKLNIEDIKPSSRRYPGIIFETERSLGDQILNIESMNTSIINDFSTIINNGDKVILYSKNPKIIDSFYNEILLMNENVKWGTTVSKSYIPENYDSFFEKNLSLVDWLRQWAKNDEEREEVYVRGFLGKMLFSGEEALKSCTVLSGGEKVRCMLSKMMMDKSNFLILNEPTNHLDLESITALNNSLINFKGNIFLTTQDFQFANSVGNRVIEIATNGYIDKLMNFGEYLNDDRVKILREKIY